MIARNSEALKKKKKKNVEPISTLRLWTICLKLYKGIHHVFFFFYYIFQNLEFN